MTAILMSSIIGSATNNANIHGNVKELDRALEESIKKQMAGVKVIVIVHKWVH